MIKKFIEYISDVKKWENFDTYLTLLVCAGFIVHSIFFSNSLDVVSTGIFTVLLLLAIGIIRNRQTDITIQSTLQNLISKTNPSASAFIKKWEQEFLEKRLETAKEICFLATALAGFLGELDGQLVNFLNRGGKLRCIFNTPNGEAVKMLASQNIGIDADFEHISSEIKTTLQTLQHIANSAQNPENVQVKVIDHLSSSVMTVIDPSFPDAVVSATIHGFGQHYRNRPSFTIYKSKDNEWFEFFYHTFENLWNSEKSIPIDLSQEIKIENI